MHFEEESAVFANGYIWSVRAGEEVTMTPRLWHKQVERESPLTEIVPDSEEDKKRHFRNVRMR